MAIGKMPPHSFNNFKDAILLLCLTFPRLSAARGPGTCDDPTFGSDILRIELNPNAWTTNPSLSSERASYLWIGTQYEGGSQKPPGQPYPIVAALSTAHNQTYISTTSTGLKEAPCPNSYQLNDDRDLKNSFDYNEYTFNTSHTCHGYYDLDTSAPIYFQTAANFTGSPENALTTTAVKNANVKYGTAFTNLVLPQHYYSTGPQGGLFGSNAFYDSFGNNDTAGSGPILGFVDTSEQQVLGLGLNSTFMKFFYESGRTASRSIGLYYGVPSSAGAGLERNGTMIVGGYSKSRVQGELLGETFPLGAFKLARQCPWEVDVSSISISGQEFVKAPFTACIEPQESALALPKALYQLLKDSESGSADLTITLSNGLNVTIPSSLISLRESTDSPILGAPFLSQVYVFADYQKRTLSVGRANNTMDYTKGPDELQCVQHDAEDGDLGWAVGSQEAYEKEQATQTKTSSAAEKTGAGNGQGKNSGGVRGVVGGGIGLTVLVIGFGLLC
ncbi:hypothetical protein VTL71DRAFT_15453 [Oculimacula yallundae]|uniref:Peptidase A1 domain-containing protein n=1 Tax=Oculimacula yallundae TaxID=86028 RepID=A0ABR4CH96_9HELO